MTKYVEIAVNVPHVEGVFHYHLTPALMEVIKPGHLVVVPFGKQRVQGVVLRFVDQPEVEYTKAVEALFDEQVSLTPQQIVLAQDIADRTFASLAPCVALMLPAGVGQLADTLYRLGDSSELQEVKNTTLQNKVLDMLRQRGPMSGRQLNRALPRRNWRYAIKPLLADGRIESSPILPPPKVRRKLVRTVQLSVPPELVQTDVQGLSNKEEVQQRRQRLLRVLAEAKEPVELSWIIAEMGRFLQKGELKKGKSRIIKDLERLNKLELVLLRQQEVWRDPLAGLAYDPAISPVLTPHQQSAWNSIHTSLEKTVAGETVLPILLHGVTGSGKTELYLRAVAETLKHGRQAIVLVPEIALTPQTIRRFMARFPGRVGVLHSGLSDGERYDTWRRARQGKLAVIVGPRSALFSPLPDIGVIVVDESHDDSYYQDTRMPFYHARSTALAYARICKALCIMGSATPDATSYHLAQKGRLQLLELPARILAHQETVKAYAREWGQIPSYREVEEGVAMAEMPPIHVVDMRTELHQGNRSIFSLALLQALEEVLAKNQQAILFLNRRGTASYVFCRDCGHVMICPHCEMSFTFHARAEKQLYCHHCGYRRSMPKSCPNCGRQRIRQYGTGTERVEQEVQTLFPKARTLRWDHETTRQKGSHEVILNHFINHRADVLVGTQMLAKGLDLPLVTLVGVVLADVGLHLPDYRAAERAFQVLAQVAGRAGRSPLGGRVILQTFEPEHYAIQAASQHDYAGFIKQELTYRRQLGYPPFNRIVRLLFQNPDMQQAEFAAKGLAKRIRRWIKTSGRSATEMTGPVPAYYARLDGLYRWQIILRGPDPASLLEGHNLGEWRVEVEPQSLL